MKCEIQGPYYLLNSPKFDIRTGLGVVVSSSFLPSFPPISLLPSLPSFLVPFLLSSFLRSFVLLVFPLNRVW